ncbi:MAG: FtsQ-type POTRA domain-containing protein [Candidatus Taylorbacteria bacterium]|nr:FtsQ-type POTRA domain-containing protein [Candidatus Taylorbacteria bacterium]
MALHKSSQRDFLRSQSVVKKRRKKRMIRLGVRLGLLLLLIISVDLLSQIEFFSIKATVISGNIHMTTEEIQGIVDESLSGKYLLLFPKKNGFLYPKNEIVENIQNRYPRVSSVKVFTESFSTLNVRIEERKQIASWCGAITCYEVDGGGYIYAEAEPTEGILIFKGLEEHIGSKPIGVEMLETEIFNEILEVTSKMAEINLPVREVEFRSRDEVYFWVSGKDSKRVIFTSRKKYTEAFENLSAALKSKAFASSTDFEYIDTRFGNKVFYRVNQSAKSTSTESKVKR